MTHLFLWRLHSLDKGHRSPAIIAITATDCSDGQLKIRLLIIQVIDSIRIRKFVYVYCWTMHKSSSSITPLVNWFKVWTNPESTGFTIEDLRT